MADQNDPQTPPAPAQAPQSPTPQPVVVPAVEAGFKAVLKDLWNKFGPLFVIVGVLILIAKFGDIVMDVLGWSSKRDVEKAQTTDTKLKAEEDAANQQANDLVKKANDLPNQEGPISDDWDKKKN